MASAGALAYVLDHDAVGAASASAMSVTPGEDVTLRGLLIPFVVRPADVREAVAWAQVREALGNVTGALETGEAGLVVLLTSDDPLPPPGTAVVATGEVALRVPHPDGSGRDLLVLRAERVATPILFG
jgi:hypothetical protein